MKEWDEVNKQVEKSKIKRIPWKQILGESLTAIIKKNRMKGYNSETTLNYLINNPQIQNYIEKYPKMKETLLKNLRISVAARYGESNTEEKLRRSFR